MRYLALATDYDGTLAHDGIVYPSTLEALQRLRQSGRHLLLVTGRQMPDLIATFPEFEIFERIVAENGAVIYNPATKEETVLVEPPPEEFAATLERERVTPLAIGRVIVATLDDQKEIVLNTIQQLGLELQIIFNKGSLMVLPSGVNKATGLKCALEQLGLSAHNTVAVGDAENDHAFLSACERAVAVANALPSVRDKADLLTKGARGQGVEELIAAMIRDDLQDVASRRGDDAVLLGTAGDKEIRVPVHGSAILVAGTSGGGKSTLTTGFMERLRDADYQFCAVDPEGDYQTFDGAMVLGDSKRAATVDEIMDALEHAGQSVIVNLLGYALDDRPNFFQALLPRIRGLRARTGRPHWLILDEAHHLAPAAQDGVNQVSPADLASAMLITLEPDHLPQAVLAALDRIVAVGDKADETIRTFCGANGLSCPALTPTKLERGKALYWSREDPAEPLVFDVASCRTERVRHSRKYASADLTPDRSFYFRGPDAKLNLRAPNLLTFVRLMEGVDDATWLHHLRLNEYSEWFRKNIKNEELAGAAAAVEAEGTLSADESRARIKQEIEQRFTLPG